MSWQQSVRPEGSAENPLIYWVVLCDLWWLDDAWEGLQETLKPRYGDAVGQKPGLGWNRDEVWKEMTRTSSGELPAPCLAPEAEVSRVLVLSYLFPCAGSGLFLGFLHPDPMVTLPAHNGVYVAPGTASATPNKRRGGGEEFGETPVPVWVGAGCSCDMLGP